jgi:hypothetical protein
MAKKTSKKVTAPKATSRLRRYARPIARVLILGSLIGISFSLGARNTRKSEVNGCVKGITAFVETVLGGTISNQENLVTACSKIVNGQPLN